MSTLVKYPSTSLYIPLAVIHIVDLSAAARNSCLIAIGCPEDRATTLNQKDVSYRRVMSR